MLEPTLYYKGQSKYSDISRITLQLAYTCTILSKSYINVLSDTSLKDGWMDGLGFCVLSKYYCYSGRMIMKVLGALVQNLVFIRIRNRDPWSFDYADASTLLIHYLYRLLLKNMLLFKE